MPDLRGLFLRGYGSQSHIKENGSKIGNSETVHISDGIGIIQGDAQRNIIANMHTDYGGSLPEYLRNDNGTVYYKRSFSGSIRCDAYGTSDILLEFDASRTVPTANENRPVNMAVRYLIRALP